MAVLKQVKVAGGLWLYAFRFFKKNKNCVKKISSRNGILYKFLTKICLKSFVSSYHFCCYHFYFIIFIWNHLQKYFLFTTWTSLWISDSLTVWQIIFSFFFLTATFEGTSCVFVPKCFNCSDSFVPVPFLLRHYVGRDKIKWKL